MTAHAWPLTQGDSKTRCRKSKVHERHDTDSIRQSGPVRKRAANRRLVPKVTGGQLRLSLTNTFYEKVVKVKADLAAILKFFLPLRSRRSRLTIWTRPRWHPSGGAAASMCASAFCWHTSCQRRGGNPHAHAFPRRGKRERGNSDFLAAAGSS